MAKKQYVEPCLEVTPFSEVDVILASFTSEEVGEEWEWTDLR